jgi:transcriptional regulator with XRE-family HTH domain
MSQQKLATRLQVYGVRIDRSAIAKIESGRRPVSDIEVAGIVQALGLELTWLFADSSRWFQQQDRSTA